MKDKVKTIMQHLARAKAYTNKKETLNALLATAAAMKATVQLNGLPEKAKEILDKSIWDVVQGLNTTKEVLKAHPTGICPKKGDWIGSLTLMAPLIKSMVERKKRAEAAAAEMKRDRLNKLDTHLVRGHRLLEAGNLGEAIRAYEGAKQFYEDEHKMFFVIGNQLLSTKHPKHAIPYLKKAMEVDPEGEDAYMAAGKAYFEATQFKDVVKTMDGCIEKYGESGDSLYLKARALMKDKKLPEALAAAEAAYDFDPTLSKARKLMGKLQKKLKK